MIHQQETSEFGYWLRAPSPPKRYKKGPGRHAPRRETRQYSQDVCEGAQFSAATRGSKSGTNDGGEEGFFPNYKRSKAQKKMHGKGGVNPRAETHRGDPGAGAPGKKKN
jgi:hypothetical protein